ncbi:MAG: YigZ family protein [Methylococcales bacterium]|nr:YigZ family protein [Methylococcales bacterium]
MNCVNSRVEIEDTIKKSRFVGVIIPCQTESEAIQHLNQKYQQHANASHIAFAYRIKSTTGIITRFHDAGEPSGTAGRPIFQYLEGHDLINLICLVIRYYGGIKLGAGGLTRAYGNTAKKTIENSTINKFVEYTQVKFKLHYNQMQNFEYQLAKLKGTIIKKEFSENINLLVKIPTINSNTLTSLFTT